MLRIVDQARYEIFKEVLASISLAEETVTPAETAVRAYQITQAAAEKLKASGIAEPRE